MKEERNEELDYQTALFMLLGIIEQEVNIKDKDAQVSLDTLATEIFNEKLQSLRLNGNEINFNDILQETLEELGF